MQKNYLKQLLQQSKLLTRKTLNFFYQKVRQKKAVTKKKKPDTVWSYVWIIVLALFIKSTLLTIFIIPSKSMVPTLKVGDTLVVSRLKFGLFNPFYELYFKKKLLFFFPNPFFKSSNPLISSQYLIDFKRKPKRFDILIFKAPVEVYPDVVYSWQDPFINKTYVHRFYLPDKSGFDYVKRVIGLPGEIVTIKNGYVYINGKMIAQNFNWNNDNSYFGPIKVPQDSYFVLGDNRRYSADSRVWGFVHKKNIVTTARYVSLPPWHWGKLR